VRKVDPAEALVLLDVLDEQGDLVNTAYFAMLDSKSMRSRADMRPSPMVALTVKAFSADASSVSTDPMSEWVSSSARSSMM